MRKLPTRIVTKPWGRSDLPTPFTNAEREKVGEIWFEPPRELDELLVKFIFTSENLSVQCHPSDAQTGAKGLGSQGKEECWLVLDAEPDAQLAIGFNRPMDTDAIRRAALDGSIEAMLTWFPVTAGDFFYIPANTVHAIGAGITLVEVQQNSDITYRLYDYGRPRELHLDEGVEIALGSPHPGSLRRQTLGKGSTPLVDGPHFRLDLISGLPSPETLSRYSGASLVVPLEGSPIIGSQAVKPGECVLTESIDAVTFPSDGRCIVTQPT